MNYCSNCNELINAKKCAKCGNKNLREVQPEDYCYFATLTNMQVNLFVPRLEEKNVTVVTMPELKYRVTCATAGKSPCQKLFVKFKDIDTAVNLYKAHFKN